jgi:hypothetical protein
MDINAITRAAGNIADTGTKQEVDVAILKKAQEIASSTATQLIDAIEPAQSAHSLPEHLGNTINTTA